MIELICLSWPGNDENDGSSQLAVAGHVVSHLVHDDAVQLLVRHRVLEGNGIELLVII